MKTIKSILIAAIFLLIATTAWSITNNGAPRATPAIKKNAMVKKEAMLDRFLRYVAVESGSKKPFYPITPGQIEMAELLKTDAEALGAKVVKTDWQYVYVDIPSNIKKDVPILGFSCHLDYTPEANGTGIKPTVLEYKGGDIHLANGTMISPVNPDGEDLPRMIGKTLIHTDGTTLLGGDDKNGCTILMSLIETLMNPSVKHGRVQFVFCPNEDVGGAAEYIDTALFFPDILFDVDSPGGNEVFDNNFTAQQMEVLFIGNPAHPQEAKAKKLGDALAAAATYIASVPLEYRPENTEGMQGYMQHFSMTADSSNYKVESRIRYFDKAEGVLFNNIFEESIDKIRHDFPNVKTEILKNYIIYDNVAYTMHPASHLILDGASAKSGINITYKSKRAGTTAALFAAKGLRGGIGIFSGQHNAHSIHEYSCLEEMFDSYKLLLQVVSEVTSLDK